MTLGEIVNAWLEAFKKNKHLNCVPFQINHHVCYIPNTEAAMMFILCPLLVNGQYWQARIVEYQELAKKVKVWVVFYTREHVEVWAEPINEADIGIATMASLPQLFADFSP